VVDRLTDQDLDLMMAGIALDAGEDLFHGGVGAFEDLKEGAGVIEQHTGDPMDDILGSCQDQEVV
jgi:hypothetical protein